MLNCLLRDPSLKNVAKSFYFDRFCDVLIHARSESLLLGNVEDVRGERDDWRSDSHLSDSLRGFRARKFRHFNVHEDEIVIVLSDAFQSLETIGSEVALVS